MRRTAERGYATSWIQTTATLGFFLSLLVIGLCRVNMTTETFSTWGWRIPFLVSLVLLVFSVYIRLKLNESPVFQRMKAEGKGSKSPLTDSFLRYPNNKYVLLALLGATAGQGVVWYTGQFYALFFLTITLKADYLTAYWLIALSLLIGTPFFIVFGSLSDRIGRLKIILVGCVIAALTYFPLFSLLAKNVNPDLVAYQQANPISVTVDRDTCSFHVFVFPKTVFTDCDKAKDLLTKAGLSFETLDGAAGSAPKLTIGQTTVDGFSADTWNEALITTGYPNLKKEQKDGKDVYTTVNADKSKINWPMTVLILTIMMIYVTMVYGPIAAYLVELFPTRIRYTSMSLPYHIGNGWFGRDAAAARHRHRGGDRQHLLRPVVSDRGGGDDGDHRILLPPRHQERRHRADLSGLREARWKPRPRGGVSLLALASPGGINYKPARFVVVPFPTGNLRPR